MMKLAGLRLVAPALALVIVGACGTAAAPPAVPVRTVAAPSPVPPDSAHPPAASARLALRAVVPRPELSTAFREERVDGGIAVYDSASDELYASDAALAKRPFVPASTFKILHAAIALELGVLDDPESKLVWDGQYTKIEEWNQDHTLRTAMRVSCLPCFEGIARAIGPERLKEWVERCDYGNSDTSGPAPFWIRGNLRVSALEQLDFLRRLDTGSLPISSRTLDMVRDVIALDVGPSHVLYGKTGLTAPPESEALVGWFVGFVALEKRSVYFATVITGHARDVEMIPVRRRVTERVLRSLGVLPG